MPLDGSSSSATIAPLMKDDSYTFCELPRVNPNNKVPYLAIFRLRSSEGLLWREVADAG